MNIRTTLLQKERLLGRRRPNLAPESRASASAQTATSGRREAKMKDGLAGFQRILGLTGLRGANSATLSARRIDPDRLIQLASLRSLAAQPITWNRSTSPRHIYYLTV
jgi:hypothetical protein